MTELDLVAQLREELRATEQYADRLRRALNALEPPVKATASQPKAPPKAKRSKAQKARSWTPRENTVELVDATIQGAGKPVTLSEIAEAAGLARETVGRAVGVLRDRDQARLAGTERRGSMMAKVYAPMPLMVSEDAASEIDDRTAVNGRGH